MRCFHADAVTLLARTRNAVTLRMARGNKLSDYLPERRDAGKMRLYDGAADAASIGNIMRLVVVQSSNR